jgi:hypothetical protein
LGLRPHIFLAAGRLTATNRWLLDGFWRAALRAEWLPPARIDGCLRPGDRVLGRFDVTPTLDGVEEGIWALRKTTRFGVTVLNGADALLLSHDKLATALAFARAGLPHPGIAQVGGRSCTRRRVRAVRCRRLVRRPLIQ